jgi:hypothetical protein
MYRGLCQVYKSDIGITLVSLHCFLLEGKIFFSIQEYGTASVYDFFNVDVSNSVNTAFINCFEFHHSCVHTVSFSPIIY